MQAEAQGEEYDVEDLLKCELRDNGKFYFLIKWDGYSEEENTMEPYENITSPMFRYGQLAHAVGSSLSHHADEFTSSPACRTADGRSHTQVYVSAMSPHNVHTYIIHTRCIIRGWFRPGAASPPSLPIPRLSAYTVPAGGGGAGEGRRDREKTSPRFL